MISTAVRAIQTPCSLPSLQSQRLIILVFNLFLEPGPRVKSMRFRRKLVIKCSNRLYPLFYITHSRTLSEVCPLVILIYTHFLRMGRINMPLFLDFICPLLFSYLVPFSAPARHFSNSWFYSLPYSLILTETYPRKEEELVSIRLRFRRYRNLPVNKVGSSIDRIDNPSGRICPLYFATARHSFLADKPRNIYKLKGFND